MSFKSMLLQFSTSFLSINRLTSLKYYSNITRLKI